MTYSAKALLWVLVTTLSTAHASGHQTVCPFKAAELQTFVLADARYQHSPMKLTLPTALGARAVLSGKGVMVIAWNPATATSMIELLLGLGPGRPPETAASSASKDSKDRYRFEIQVRLHRPHDIVRMRSNWPQPIAGQFRFQEVSGFAPEAVLAMTAQASSGAIEGSAYLDEGLAATILTSTNIDRVTPQISADVAGRFGATLLIVSQACNH